MIDETSLMQRLKPHPDTAELGVWLSRDEIIGLIEGDKSEDEIDDLKKELAEAEEAAEEFETQHVRLTAGVSEIVNSIKKSDSIDDIIAQLQGVLP